MIDLSKNATCGIRNRFFLNPFYLFGTIWALSCLGYTQSLFSIYPSIDPDNFFFFAILVCISFLLGLVFDRCVLKKLNLSFALTYFAKPPVYLFFLCLLFVAVGFAINKSFPVVNVLAGNIHSYGKFEIPYFNTFYVSLFVILNLRASLCFVYGQKKYRGFCLAMIAFVYFYFLLLYSRGMVLYCLVSSVLAFVSKIKLTPFRVILIVIAAVFTAYIFSGLGNLRNGSAWSDSSVVMSLSAMRDDSSYLSPFAGAISYAETPLGNLLYNIPRAQELTLEKALYILLPDFVSKRLFPDIALTMSLPSPALTVGTMFAQSAVAGGLAGILLQFGEMCILFFLLPWLTKKKPDISLMITLNLSAISVFSVFDNLLLLWGFSFSIVLLFAVSFFYHPRNKIKEVYSIYGLLCSNGTI